MAIQKKTKNYIEQLTWLRGLAAFFVIISHTIRATEVKYSIHDEADVSFFLSLFDLGSFGVVLFFTLSGCTLYLSNADKVSFGNLTTFYIKRFFRIWPAFFVSLIVYIAFGFIFKAWYGAPQGHWIEAQFYTPFSIQDIISYLLLIFNISGPEGCFNNAYWSLPVEFQYYLIFPFIVMSLKYTGILGPLIISILLYFLPKLEFIYINSDTVFTLAFSFCGGILVGYIFRKYQITINTVLGCMALVSLFFLSSMIANSYITLPDFPIISSKWNWYGGIAIFSVFISLLIKINIQNRVEKFLKHYGSISYSSYLYHNIFIAISVLFITNFEVYDNNLRFLITLLFTLLSSYIVATISYHYIEQPSITLGRYIIRKYLN